MQVLRNTNAYLIRAALAVVGVLIGSLIFVTTSVAQPASAAPVWCRACKCWWALWCKPAMRSTEYTCGKTWASTAA